MFFFYNNAPASHLFIFDLTLHLYFSLNDFIPQVHPEIRSDSQSERPCGAHVSSVRLRAVQTSFYGS